MRMKLGRPDITRYADRFDLAPATGGLGVTFLGVATLLLDDGDTAILTDGFFSRPSLARVALGRIAPDHARIAHGLQRAGIERLDAVVPLHSHYDHVLDSPAVAERTGAVVVGDGSAANVARGQGLPADRILVVKDGGAASFGAFELTWVRSEHCPPDRYPGAISAPVVPPTRAGAYRCGEAWSLLVVRRDGQRVLVQGSAGFRRGALVGQRAEIAYLGIGQLGLQPEAYLRTYWEETVTTVGARRVVLIHWDDFFRPLVRGLRALPFAGDDLDVTMRVLVGLADRDGVTLHLPTLWRREDPWA